MSDLYYTILQTIFDTKLCADSSGGIACARCLAASIADTLDDELNALQTRVRLLVQELDSMGDDVKIDAGFAAAKLAGALIRSADTQ